MTARAGRPQAPFTSGELAPALLEAKGLKYYRAGAKTMRNVEALPQGGFRQAPGLRRVGDVRKTPVAISIATATLGAPNGGTAANIRDSNEATVLTTSSLSGAGPHVLATITFGSPPDVAAVDVQGAYGGGSQTGLIAVQYNDGASWITFAGSHAFVSGSTKARNRRFAAAPGATIAHTAWRIVALDLTASGAVSIGEVAFWGELTTYSADRGRPFTAGDGATTEHIWQAGHTDVYNAAGYVASYKNPITDSAVPALKTIQQLDTLLAFHPDMQTHRVLRQGSNVEWQSGAAPLVNLPLYDFGSVYVNGVSAVWNITLSGVPADSTADDDHYVITVNGDDTTSLIIPLDGGGTAPDLSAFAALVQAAIIALPGVETGVTVAYVAGAGAEGGSANEHILKVTFAGAGNEGDDWTVSMKCLDNTAVVCSAYKRTRGVAPGEDIVSSLRGWPRTGMFYQQRLLLGGFKSLPNAWMASWAGNFYDFDVNTSSAIGALLVPMAETEGGEAIEYMAATRSPLLLTSRAEYWLANRLISKTGDPPNHVQGSRHGVSDRVPVIENEGAALFVDPSQSVLFEFRYNEVDQNFVTQNLSILSSHLLDDVTDMALQRADQHSDANRLHLVLDNGECRLFVLLREQEVTAGHRRVTDGDFLSVHVNGLNQTVYTTERTVNGAARRFVERADPDLLLDQAVSGTNAPASRTIEGLDEFEGVEVWVVADDDVYGPFTVEDGAIADVGDEIEEWTVGRWQAPLVETLPLSREIGPGVVLERRARIHTVRLSLLNTTSIAVGANNGKIYDVPLFKFGDEMGVPGLQRPFTGMVKIQGLTGYADQPTVIITQKKPGLMHVRGITIEAAL